MQPGDSANQMSHPAQVVYSFWDYLRYEVLSRTTALPQAAPILKSPVKAQSGNRMEVDLDGNQGLIWRGHAYATGSGGPPHAHHWSGDGDREAAKSLVASQGQPQRESLVMERRRGESGRP
jgi:hypothetical protein